MQLILDVLWVFAVVVKQGSPSVILQLIIDEVALLQLLVVNLQVHLLLQKLVQIELNIIVLLLAEVRDLVVDVDVDGGDAVEVF